MPDGRRGGRCGRDRGGRRFGFGPRHLFLKLGRRLSGLLPNRGFQRDLLRPQTVQLALDRGLGRLADLLVQPVPPEPPFRELPAV